MTRWLLLTLALAGCGGTIGESTYLMHDSGSMQKTQPSKDASPVETSSCEPVFDDAHVLVPACLKEGGPRAVCHATVADASEQVPGDWCCECNP